ncbi:MAG: hypothetical protein AB7G11_11130 [Phycisphaerales bacterium]
MTPKFSEAERRRQRALDATIDFFRDTAVNVDVNTLIETAKAVEAYLVGEPRTKAKTATKAKAKANP